MTGDAEPPDSMRTEAGSGPAYGHHSGRNCPRSGLASCSLRRARGRRAAIHQLDRLTAASQQLLRRVWMPALRKTGFSGVHFHDLRHSGNLLAAAAGATLRELMARMGHSSTRAALIY